ncbi:hypothetical protein [Streptomyces nanshensis]|uniref:Uncharacterized protein n=1 Tax=Streptomyces nanshensis TaxID=518642 RepID=A0A1E7L9C0_9ACTN|nr:hypothetical protein [Streptomyces nanshensis]OEV12583.1 hypothetical protein AN218_07620 [Streptomyces nanshensis]
MLALFAVLQLGGFACAAAGCWRSLIRPTEHRRRIGLRLCVTGFVASTVTWLALQLALPGVLE